MPDQPRHPYNVYAANGKDMVVLLHGIGHNALDMMFLELVLKRKGYATLNLTYPSTKHGIHDLASWLNDKLAEQAVWDKHGRVHFVGHSMGGLVIGAYLDAFQCDVMKKKIGRVVMQGTPHGGSEVADFLRDNPIYRRAFGPAGQELTTAERSHKKIKPWYELGIVAGTRNWLYPLGQFCIKSDNDGCVSVDSTKLEGMKDHVIVPVMHGTLVWSPLVHKQTDHFLKHGKFMPAPSRASKPNPR